MPTLAEIMTKDPFAVTGDTTVADVAAQMVKQRVGSAVVMDGAWLAGIFTERDVLRAAASGRDLTASTVGEWMTPDPMTAEPEMDAGEAAQVMLSRGFRHLPVMESNRVTGIVSLRDVLSTRIRRPGG
ncbi:MAG TPA: CBS domain-containing protein [Actinomycetota bacterium]|nr:CBS domain-containing protein [Actinomycetota bacterium]